MLSIVSLNMVGAEVTYCNSDTRPGIAKHEADSYKNYLAKNRSDFSGMTATQVKNSFISMGLNYDGSCKTPGADPAELVIAPAVTAKPINLATSTTIINNYYYGPTTTPEIAQIKLPTIEEYNKLIVNLVPTTTPTTTEVKKTEATTTSIAIATPIRKLTLNIRLGSKGDEVKILQSKLGLTETGLFDKATRRAVIEYQKKNSIVASGNVFNTTREMLNK